jgi:antirestriction protein ArdC
MTSETSRGVEWAALLKEAVEQPGIILEAYRSFHSYSLGNCLLAFLQCQERGIPFGPIATYRRWQELGRQVKKGEKALTLCMPVTRKASEKVRNVNRDIAIEEDTFHTFFIYRARWFVLTQTEGEDIEPEPIPGWEKAQALCELGITEEPFEAANGNIQGYSVPGRKIAISPLAQLPSKTLFHELAHQLLGHVGDQTIIEGERLPKNLREAEAESVALICCEALGLEGAPYCRGYIQAWLAGDEIPEKSARRIFAAADRILRAGTAVVPQPAS